MCVCSGLGFLLIRVSSPSLTVLWADNVDSSSSLDPMAHSLNCELASKIFILQGIVEFCAIMMLCTFPLWSVFYNCKQINKIDILLILFLFLFSFQTEKGSLEKEKGSNSSTQTSRVYSNLERWGLFINSHDETLKTLYMTVYFYKLVEY